MAHESRLKLSIIVPMYNVENYIERALTSVGSKNGQQVEIIVINDGSSDGSSRVANDVLKKLENTNNYLLSQDNNGVSSARNRGIAAAKGEYLYFLDGDDFVDEDMITTVVDVIERKNSEPDVICWAYNKVDEKKLIMEYFKEYKAGLGILTGTEALEKILLSKELSIWTGSAVYKRDTIIGNGLDFTERCESGEDQEFIYKALSKSNVVVFINKVLSYYFLREGSITNSISIKRFDAINALVRASDYLKAQGISTEIIQHIRVNRTIETYISSKTSCI